MLIANAFGQVADKIFSQNADSFSPGIAWLGAIAYTIQISIFLVILIWQ